MNMFEEARSLAIMMEMRSLSQSETAKKLGVSQSFVANKLRLLKLDEQMQKQIISANLTERHARALLRLRDRKKQREVLNRVCEENLSVQRTEALVDFYHLGEAAQLIGRAEALKRINIFLDSLSDSLSILSAAGVQTSKKVTHEENKTYITICIKESENGIICK